MRFQFARGQQEEFIKTFLKQERVSLTTAARFLSVGKTTLKRWLKEEVTLPETAFHTICVKMPDLRIYKKQIIKILPDNWGQIQGGRSRVIQIKNINEYLSSVRAAKNKKRLVAAQITKRKLKFSSQLLNNLIEDHVDLEALLATCLLTDGSLTRDGNSYRIGYYTKDQALRKFVKSLLFELSAFVPSEILTKKSVYAIRVSDYRLAQQLLRLSPSYKKTARNHQTIKSYLKERQPSLAFLKEADEKTMTWCIRLAFSAEGSISISQSNTIELNFACYHPKLAKEWLEIFKNYGLEGHIGREKKSWSGIDGVRVYSLASLKNFVGLGGFLPGVVVSNKSKRYKGLEKNEVLNKAVRARSFPVSRKHGAESLVGASD